LPADLSRDLLTRVSSVWNMYGPTETTVWSTVYRVEGDEGSIPIGHPIANTQVYVLDEQRNLCPVGVRGEIWIAGDGVTSGYWQRPELTADRFVTDPFAASPGALMYRTGDLGRLRFDGRLECAGRTDFQVKVRGHRIELGEIESALASHPAVARCVVDARALPSGERALCAYVQWRLEPLDDWQPLREHMRQGLPEYMVPAAYVTIASVPMTPNGKIDRRALPDPEGSGGAAGQLLRPRRALAARDAGHRNDGARQRQADPPGELRAGDAQPDRDPLRRQRKGADRTVGKLAGAIRQADLQHPAAPLRPRVRERVRHARMGL
jgi:acyl-coenzyme A synthetase/AMP-(fatty) acid ligase